MKKENTEKVFYLCDGEVENCKKTMCYKNGGNCNYTTDISHAKNFHKTDAPYPVFYENEAAQQCRQVTGLTVVGDSFMNDIEDGFYKKEIRDKIERQMNTLENKMRGMTEATGLRIVDALYTLIDLLLMEIQYGADHEK